MAELYVVGECCPVGCGIEVVLLRARPGGRLIAYCELCGLVWSDSANAQFAHGLDEMIPPWVLAPEGVEFPGAGDIQNAGFAASVLRTMPTSDSWTEGLDDLNTLIRREVERSRTKVTRESGDMGYTSR